MTEPVQVHIEVKLNNNQDNGQCKVYRKRKRAKDSEYNQDYIYKTRTHT